MCRVSVSLLFDAGRKSAAVSARARNQLIQRRQILKRATSFSSATAPPFLILRQVSDKFCIISDI